MTIIETTDMHRREVAASGQGSSPGLAGGGVRAASQAWTIRLSLLVSVLAVVATTAGIFTANRAHHRTFISLHGQTITLQGGGLYANETVSGAAQAIGQDVVTLLVGIPLLLAATYLAARGSLRGQVLRAGALCIRRASSPSSCRCWHSMCGGCRPWFRRALPGGRSRGW